MGRGVSSLGQGGGEQLNGREGRARPSAHAELRLSLPGGSGGESGVHLGWAQSQGRHRSDLRARGAQYPLLQLSPLATALSGM